MTGPLASRSINPSFFFAFAGFLLPLVAMLLPRPGSKQGKAFHSATLSTAARATQIIAFATGSCRVRDQFGFCLAVGAANPYSSQRDLVARLDGIRDALFGFLAGMERAHA